VLPPIYKYTAQAWKTANRVGCTAAIHLPTNKHQVVSKVMNVYSDKLRRNVPPTTETCSSAFSYIDVKIVTSLTDARVSTQQMDHLREAVVFDALVKAHLETNHFAEAFRATEEGNRTVAQQNQAYCWPISLVIM
jgi:hypothetical protein